MQKLDVVMAALHVLFKKHEKPVLKLLALAQANASHLAMDTSASSEEGGDGFLGMQPSISLIVTYMKRDKCTIVEFCVLNAEGMSHIFLNLGYSYELR